MTSLSDAAAEALSKHHGELSLSGLTSLSDAAAEALGRHKGGWLRLHCLETLSDAAALSLSKHEGVLELRDIHGLYDQLSELNAGYRELLLRIIERTRYDDEGGDADWSVCNAEKWL